MAVGDDRQSLQSCLGEAILLAVENEFLHSWSAIWVAVEAPSPVDRFEGKASILIRMGEAVESFDYDIDWDLQNRGQGQLTDRLIYDHEDRLDGSINFYIRHFYPHLSHLQGLPGYQTRR